MTGLTKDDLTVLSLAAGVSRRLQTILDECAELEKENKPFPQELVDRGFHAIRMFQQISGVLHRRFGDGGITTL